MEKGNGIAAVELYNIQKHKHIKLSLDGINILVGETESGKTSILRGLLWNMKNNTSGSSIVTNDGSTYCSCTVKVDGHSVARKWSTTENSYSIDGKVLTSIRTSVPSEIKELYNIDDVNIQCRRDLPFMLYYKDTECASQFSQMLNIEEIDRATSAINSRVRECTNAYSAAKDNITKLETELHSISFVDDAAREIEEVFRLSKEVDDLHRKYSTMSTLYDTIDNETGTLRHAVTRLVIYETSYTPIKTLCEETKAIKSKVEAYTSIHEESVKVYGYLAKTSLYISSTQDRIKFIEDTYFCATKHKNTLKELIPLYNGIKECKDAVSKDEAIISAQLYPKIICGVSEKTNMEKRYKELSLLCTNLETAMLSLNAAIKKYNTEHNKFEKAFPDVCPLCGTPVKGDHAHISLS